jgi:Domain of unknown function (DUF4105)
MTGRGLLRAFAVGLLALLAALSLLWAVLAIYFSNLPGQPLRAAAAAAYGLGVVSAFALLPRRGRTMRWYLVSFAAVLLWWLTITPSHARDWATEVAVLPQPMFAGDRVTIRNVRDFEYRSEGEYTARYEDRTYDLATLASVDLILSYWDGNRDIAHVILSFAFTGGEHVAVSVETRPEKGEAYSAIGGMFKQYEVIYVIADERDVVQLRTSFRKEDVYLYPMRFPREAARAMFEQLLREAAALVERPRFYQVLRHNCTTTWVTFAEQATGRRVPFDSRLLLNGYFDQLMYERERLVADASHGLPYPEMRRQHQITDVAQRYRGDPEFSRKVRTHLPARQ